MAHFDLQPLDATPLSCSPDDLAALLEPFIDGGRSRPGIWIAEVNRRRLKIIKKWGKSRLARGKRENRDRATVSEEYERAWSKRDCTAYRLDTVERDHTPWLVGRRKVFASDIGATRFRQKILVDMIEHLKPRSVLEIGCGNGINIILLACRFPRIAFTGIELTASGHQDALRFLQENKTLPPSLREFAPEPLPDCSAFKNIVFRRGSADDLPFEDRQFDFVQTILALEQMERIRDAALSEMARVTRRWVFNMEPFADANQEIWSRLYVRQRDYFAGRVEDLTRFGLQPQWATVDFPQEVFLKTCAVLASRID